MPYLSKLINGRVEDSADKYVGKLKDVLVRYKPDEYSPLEYILVRDRKKREFFIPYKYVENFSHNDISLNIRFNKVETNKPKGDFIFLESDLFDQQIVDVGGARVVRVNDLRVGMFKKKMNLLGIDVSFKGLLRRLHLDWLDFFGAFKVNFIDWRKAEPVKGKIKLNAMSKDVQKLHPADLADIIEDLSLKQGGELVDSLDSWEAAKTIEELGPELQKILMNYLPAEKTKEIINKMSIDETVDLLQIMNKNEAKKFFSHLQKNRLSNVQKLIMYEDDTAGGLMTTEFACAYPDWTVEKTIEEVRTLSKTTRSLLFVYVIDKEDNFKGVVSMRKLLLADKKEVLENILKPVSDQAVLRVDDEMDEVVERMTKYNLYNAAVLDENNKMIGMVTIDDVMRVLDPKA